MHVDIFEVYLLGPYDSRPLSLTSIAQSYIPQVLKEANVDSKHFWPASPAPAAMSEKETYIPIPQLIPGERAIDSNTEH